MPWRTLHPRGAAGFIVDGNFIESRIPTPYQLRRASIYIYLVLLGGKTFRIPNARPCIRTLARRIRAVGYLVDVYLFPNNTFESIPPDVSRYIVRIGDTVLIIILPEALASKYRSDYYADSDSTSTSSVDHHCIFDMPPTNPVLPKLEVDLFEESSLFGVDLF